MAQRFPPAASQHPVHSEPLPSRGMAATMPSKRRPPRIGFLRPGHVERAFVVLLYLAVIMRVLLRLGQAGKIQRAAGI